MAINKNKIIAASFSGGMNVDADDRVLPTGDYILLENGVVLPDKTGSGYTVKNIQSSRYITSVPYGRPLGGKMYKDVIYAFYTNDKDIALAEIFVEGTPSYNLIGVFSGLEIPDRIYDIDIVENHVTGDLLCYWTDGINPPMKVNITFLKNGGEYDSVSDMYVIKKVPPEPTIIPYKDHSLYETNTRNSSYQFATRYKYIDGEVTPLSTYSRAAFYPVVESYLDNEGLLSYFIEDGELKRMGGLDPSTAVTVSTGVHEDQNRVYVASADVILLYSDDTNSPAPLYVSADGGVTFDSVSGFNNDIAIKEVCSSDSGDVIFVLTDGNDGGAVYKSTDFGSNFSVVNKANDDVWGGISCSSNGRYLFCIKKYTRVVYDDYDSPPTSNYMLPVHVIDTENDTLIFETITSITISQDQSLSYALAKPYLNGMITPNGEYLVFAKYTLVSPNSTYFWTYKIDTGELIGKTEVYTLVDSVILTDDGKGWADGYYTNSFFSSVNNFDNSDRLYLLEDGFVGVLGSSYTRYDFNGAPIESYQFGSNFPKLGFYKGISVTSAIRNIVNYYNAVDVFVEKPGRFVEKVEVYAIDTNTSNAYLIKELDNNEDTFPDGEEGIYVTFKNDYLYRTLAPSTKNILYSNVPLLAGSQCIIGSRLFYGNYVDGVDLPSPDVEITTNVENFTKREFLSNISDDATSFEIYKDYVLPVYGVLEAGSLFQISISYFDGNEKKDVVFQHILSKSYGLLSGLGDDYWGNLDNEISVSFLKLFPAGSVITTRDYGLYSISFDSGDENIQFTKISRAVLQSHPLTYKKGQSFQLAGVYYDEYNRGSFPVFFGGVNIPDNINSPLVNINVRINHKAPSWAKKFKFVRSDRNFNYSIISGFRFATALDGNIYLMKQENELISPEAGMYLDVHAPDGGLISFQVISKVTKDSDFVTGAPSGEWVVIQDPEVSGFSASDVIRGASLYTTSIFYIRSNIDVAEDIVYYEIPGVYDVVDGRHIGNVSSQTSDDTHPYAEFSINDDGNVFYLSDLNVEVYKTGAGGIFYNGGRALLGTDMVGKVNRYSSLTWSDVFIQDSGYNGFGLFNLNDGNYLDADVSFGEINAMVPRDTNILLFQDRQISYVLVNKGAIVSASGEAITTQSKSSVVANNVVPIRGKYGSINPESIVERGGAVYFVDKLNNAIARVYGDNVVFVSNNWVSSALSELISSNDYIPMAYDGDTDELYVVFPSENAMWAYKDNSNGAGRWTRVVTPFSADYMLSNRNKVYSIVGVDIYCENNGEGYNVVHGVQAPFKLITTLKRDGFSVISFDSLILDSSRPVEAKLYLPKEFSDKFGYTEAQINIDDFEFREGEYWAPIPLVGASGYNGDPTGNIIPLGNIVSNSGNMVYFDAPISAMGAVNHELMYVDGDPVSAGDIVNIDMGNKSIEINNSLAENIMQGKFAYLVEKSYINGKKLKAPAVRIEINDSDNENKLYIFLIEISGTIK